MKYFVIKKLICNINIMIIFQSIQFYQSDLFNGEKIQYLKSKNHKFFELNKFFL